ncbi:recombinase family protein [Yeosuana marina]|uniref:recombinase family protein n=1 Tax=Yeosuana marina TaxID=1565536 RepID=UPI0030EBDCC8|tara:strand:+ start:2679 stop:4316 length:1638 start_codon:yes stop_codon:yes gene_type:complete
MKRKEYTILDFYGAIVWSYTRVSSKEQFMNNGSITSQVKRIKTFADEHHLIISKEFDAEYESSKRINTQKTLNELINAVKNTSPNKRPKIILIWSPSRFGRAGSEHIELFVSLRRKYNVFLYSVSTGDNTFTERNENEFSTQLLQAQKENFSRQDVIIPGMKDAIEKGTFLGRAPRGYDHFGPRVTDPLKVQAKQEIKLNSEGLLLKEAFKLKLYKNYTDKEILDWLLLEGLNIPKQSLNAMWSKLFYTGYFTNSLVPDVEIKGHWEPIITMKEYKLLQTKLSNSNQIGIPKINGKTSTPLVPKFLICDDCDNTMTSYFNKRKEIYYYKCGKCNKTANANTRLKSLNDGLNQQFANTIDSFKFSKSFHQLFSKQLEKIIDAEMSDLSEKRRILKTEINEAQSDYDDMEYRFALGKIPEEIFEKYGLKLKAQIEEKTKQILNLPSKKSNHQKLLNKFFKIAENPSEFYKSLNYNDKRVFQNIVFPEGFKFSLKNKECRTSKVNMIFELTNLFKDYYNSKKEKTQIQNVLESHLVAGTGLEPVNFGL